LRKEPQPWYQRGTRRLHVTSILVDSIKGMRATTALMQMAKEKPHICHNTSPQRVRKFCAGVGGRREEPCVC
jgi:hypothetical protein